MTSLDGKKKRKKGESEVNSWMLPSHNNCCDSGRYFSAKFHQELFAKHSLHHQNCYSSRVNPPGKQKQLF